MNPLVTSAVIIAFYMHLLFILALLKKRNDLADVGWGLGFLLVGLGNLKDSSNQRSLLALILVFIWALRLAMHIFLRNKNKPEDSRYQEFRKGWGNHQILGAYLQVFCLQGLLLWLVSAPVAIIISGANVPLSFIDLIGVLIWAAGMYWETVGDYQLLNFKKDPANKGKLITTGLWARSRHPNYFGEVLLWWGYFLLAINIPNGLSAIMGPLSITFLILKVSGIPMLEKGMNGRAGVEAYRKGTPVFIPLFKKSR